MSIIVPEAILEAVEEAAKKKGASLSEFIENTIVSKASEVLSDPYLELRTKRANGLGWRVLDQAPDVPPRSHDSSYLLGLILSQRPMWEVFRKDFQFLSAYAVEYRYPGETATREMAREALRYCSRP